MLTAKQHGGLSRAIQLSANQEARGAGALVGIAIVATGVAAVECAAVVGPIAAEAAAPVVEAVGVGVRAARTVGNAVGNSVRAGADKVSTAARTGGDKVSTAARQVSDEVAETAHNVTTKGKDAIIAGAAEILSDVGIGAAGRAGVTGAESAAIMAEAGAIQSARTEAAAAASSMWRHFTKVVDDMF